MFSKKLISVTETRKQAPQPETFGSTVVATLTPYLQTLTPYLRMLPTVTGATLLLLGVKQVSSHFKESPETATAPHLRGSQFGLLPAPDRRLSSTDTVNATVVPPDAQLVNKDGQTYTTFVQAGAATFDKEQSVSSVSLAPDVPNGFSLVSFPTHPQAERSSSLSQTSFLFYSETFSIREDSGTQVVVGGQTSGRVNIGYSNGSHVTPAFGIPILEDDGSNANIYWLLRGQDSQNNTLFVASADAGEDIKGFRINFDENGFPINATQFAHFSTDGVQAVSRTYIEGETEDTLVFVDDDQNLYNVRIPRSITGSETSTELTTNFDKKTLSIAASDSTYTGKHVVIVGSGASNQAIFYSADDNTAISIDLGGYTPEKVEYVKIPDDNNDYLFITASDGTLYKYLITETDDGISLTEVDTLDLGDNPFFSTVVPETGKLVFTQLSGTYQVVDPADLGEIFFEFTPPSGASSFQLSLRDQNVYAAGGNAGLSVFSNKGPSTLTPDVEVDVDTAQFNGTQVVGMIFQTDNGIVEVSFNWTVNSFPKWLNPPANFSATAEEAFSFKIRGNQTYDADGDTLTITSKGGLGLTAEYDEDSDTTTLSVDSVDKDLRADYRESIGLPRQVETEVEVSDGNANSTYKIRTEVADPLYFTVDGEQVTNATVTASVTVGTGTQVIDLPTATGIELTYARTESNTFGSLSDDGSKYLVTASTGDDDSYEIVVVVENDLGKKIYVTIELDIVIDPATVNTGADSSFTVADATVGTTTTNYPSNMVYQPQGYSFRVARLEYSINGGPRQIANTSALSTEDQPIRWNPEGGANGQMVTYLPPNSTHFGTVEDPTVVDLYWIEVSVDAAEEQNVTVHKQQVFTTQVSELDTADTSAGVGEEVAVTAVARDPQGRSVSVTVDHDDDTIEVDGPVVISEDDDDEGGHSKTVAAYVKPGLSKENEDIDLTFTAKSGNDSGSAVSETARVEVDAYIKPVITVQQSTFPVSYGSSKSFTTNDLGIVTYNEDYTVYITTSTGASVEGLTIHNNGEFNSSYSGPLFTYTPNRVIPQTTPFSVVIKVEGTIGAEDDRSSSETITVSASDSLKFNVDNGGSLSLEEDGTPVRLGVNISSNDNSSNLVATATASGDFLVSSGPDGGTASSITCPTGTVDKENACLNQIYVHNSNDNEGTGSVVVKVVSRDPDGEQETGLEVIKDEDAPTWSKPFPAQTVREGDTGFYELGYTTYDTNDSATQGNAYAGGLSDATFFLYDPADPQTQYPLIGPYANTLLNTMSLGVDGEHSGTFWVKICDLRPLCTTKQSGKLNVLQASTLFDFFWTYYPIILPAFTVVLPSIILAILNYRVQNRWKGANKTNHEAGTQLLPMAEMAREFVQLMEAQQAEDEAQQAADRAQHAASASGVVTRQPQHAHVLRTRSSSTGSSSGTIHPQTIKDFLNKEKEKMEAACKSSNLNFKVIMAARYTRIYLTALCYVYINHSRNIGEILKFDPEGWTSEVAEEFDDGDLDRIDKLLKGLTLENAGKVNNLLAELLIFKLKIFRIKKLHTINLRERSDYSDRIKDIDHMKKIFKKLLGIFEKNSRFQDTIPGRDIFNTINDILLELSQIRDELSVWLATFNTEAFPNCLITGQHTSYARQRDFMSQTWDPYFTAAQLNMRRLINDPTATYQWMAGLRANTDLFEYGGRWKSPLRSDSFSDTQLRALDLYTRLLTTIAAHTENEKVKQLVLGYDPKLLADESFLDPNQTDPQTIIPGIGLLAIYRFTSKLTGLSDEDVTPQKFTDPNINAFDNDTCLCSGTLKKLNPRKLFVSWIQFGALQGLSAADPQNTRVALKGSYPLDQFVPLETPVRLPGTEATRPELSLVRAKDIPSDLPPQNPMSLSHLFSSGVRQDGEVDPAALFRAPDSGDGEGEHKQGSQDEYLGRRTGSGVQRAQQAQRDGQFEMTNPMAARRRGTGSPSSGRAIGGESAEDG